MEAGAAQGGAPVVDESTDLEAEESAVEEEVMLVASNQAPTGSLDIALVEAQGGSEGGENEEPVPAYALGKVVMVNPVGKN